MAKASPTLELYHPHGAAVDLWKCKDPEILIEGPRGTGKTLAVLHKLNALCFKYPGIRVLMMRKFRSNMTESVLADFETHVLKDHPAYPPYKNTQRRLRQEYVYPNGSIIVVRGIDTADDVRGANFDVIALFEGTQATEKDWEQALGCLRNFKMPYQQGIVECNPDRPSHWLNVRASRPYVLSSELAGILPPARPGQTQMTRLRSRHQDNPKFYDHDKGEWKPEGAQFLSILSGFTGSFRDRFKDGLWRASEGLVYNFDPGHHLLGYKSEKFPWAEIPKHWRRIRTIDFGFTNPFVCQWWAIDPDGRMYLYREIYKSQVLVEDHAKRINELSGSAKFEATIADHDAEDRATLERHGVKTRRAWKRITPGIEAVSARLKLAGDGKPRLFVMGNTLDDFDKTLADDGAPASTLAEFDGYTYPKAGEGKSAKEEPLDLHNHGMDAMRYAVAYVDDLAKRRFKVRGGRVRGALAGAR
jgi:phage terminase large subunit